MANKLQKRIREREKQINEQKRRKELGIKNDADLSLAMKRKRNYRWSPIAVTGHDISI